MTARIVSLRVLAFTVAALVGWSGALAGQVTFTVQRRPVVEVDVVISGSPPLVGSAALDVYRGSLGEDRLVYEMPLPALPDGSSLSAASFNTLIEQYSGTVPPAPPAAPDVSINGYIGDGVYSTFDATIGLNPIGDTGSIVSSSTISDPQSYALNASYIQTVGAISTHLGLILYQQVANQHVAFYRSGYYSSIPSLSNYPNLSLTVTVPDSGTVHAKPLFDVLATAQSSGGFTLTDGDPHINAQYLPGIVDRRGILRYDLGAIPHGATITSASITFNVDTITNSPGNSPQARIYGYTGAATVSAADAQQLGDLLGTSDPVTSLGTVTVNLDPSALQSLLASGDFVGLTVLGSANGEQFGFTTLESGFDSAPTLNVTYAPEPAGAALLAGIAVPFLLSRRRKSRMRS